MVFQFPQYDPGAMIGRGVGEALGGLGGQMANQALLSSRLDNLQNQLAGETDPVKLSMGLAKAFSGIRGGSEMYNAIAPALMNRAMGQNYLASLGGGQPSGGGVQTGAPTQMQGAAPGGAPQATQMQRGGNVPSTLPLQETPTFEMPQAPQRINVPMRAAQLQVMGMTPQQSFTQANQEQADLDRQYDMQVKAYKTSLSEQQARIGRQAQKEQYVDTRLSEDFQETDPIVRNKALDIYNEQTAKNPNMSDKDVWSKFVQPQLDAYRNDRARIQLHSQRPSQLDKPGRVDSQLNTIQANVDQFKKKYGDTPQVRNQLKTWLMNNDFMEAEAAQFTNPMSKDLNKVFKAVDPMYPERMSETEEQFVPADVRKKGEQYREKITNAIEKTIGPTDSPVLIKWKLVKDKNLTDGQANQVILELNKRGALSPEQQSELGSLKRMAHPSMYDMIFGNQEFTLKMFRPFLR